MNLSVKYNLCWVSLILNKFAEIIQQLWPLANTQMQQQNKTLAQHQALLQQKISQLKK